MANALTAIRLLLIVPFAYLRTTGDPHFAALATVAMVVAIVTDLADGPLARRTGTASSFGGTFDHTSDFLFVTCGLFATAFRGAVPWLLPSLITAAFFQYVIDSYWIYRRRGLRASRLGRYNGILYFVPLCVDILVCLGWGFLHPVLTLVAWALVFSTLASMTERLILLGKVLAWPVEETARQSPR
jgi:CDP-diacylglycerol--glycerol-3-phosphate 3-phosphatidyltransferase